MIDHKIVHVAAIVDQVFGNEPIDDSGKDTFVIALVE